MIKEQLAVYELLKDMLKGQTGHLSKVTYLPQKPAFPFDTEMQQPFKRSTPEKQGISSRTLELLIRELAELKDTDIHQVMILRNGCVIGEYSFAPYQKEIWHVGHSMCKSITGMAIGLLIAEGKLKLEDRIVKIFDKKKGLLSSVRQKNITVEHLLTMTSLVTFNESGIVSGDDWVKSFLDSNVSGSPGTKFEYNSMNSYMLSAIVTEITGLSMFDYLTPRLFEPLGITRAFWEICPKGITKGGWGLFLCQEDMAKFGQLYLQKGRWKDQQLIPEEWVAASVSKKTDTPDNMGCHGYGYQIWMGGRPGAFNFNGMLGQNVVVYPDLEMVIATNAGSNELFQNCTLLDTLKNYFEGDFCPPQTLPENPVAFNSLQQAARQLEMHRQTPEGIQRGGWKRKRDPKGSRYWNMNSSMNRLNGKMYRLERQQAGLFPLIMQVFHNNFTDGISQIGFQYENGKSYLLVKEGKQSKKIQIGFGKAAVNQISIHGEPYLAAVQGVFTRDEDGTQVLKIDIAFLEEAVRRKMKIFFEEDEIRVHFDETPGKELIKEGLGGILKDVSSNPFLNGIKDLTPLDFPDLMVDQTICPVIRGVLEDTDKRGE